MSDLIQTNAIEGFKVYGQQMVDYTVDGVIGNSYSGAVCKAALAHTSAMEHTASSLASLLRARQQKLDDLSNALAIIVKALDTMKTKKQKSTDTSDEDTELWTVQTTLSKYGINMLVRSDNKITRESASTARYDIQYAIDNENNDLQQDMITLQSLIGKRDNAFSTASKLLKKADNPGATIIDSI